MPKNNRENAAEEESCSDGETNESNNNNDNKSKTELKASPVRRSKRKRKRLTRQHTDPSPSPSSAGVRKNKRQRKLSIKAEEARGARGKHTSNGEDEAALKELIRPKRKYRKKSKKEKQEKLEDKDVEKESQSPSKSTNQSQDQDQDSDADDSLDEHDMACCICRCTVDYSDMDQFNWPQEALDSDSDNEEESKLPSKGGHAKDKEHGDKVKDANHNSNADVDADPEKDIHNGKDGRENNQENKDHNDSFAVAVDITNKEQKHNCQLSETKSTKESSIVSREKESLTTQSFQNNHQDSDSSEQSDFYGVKLPYDLHDPNNALLICDGDGCNRCFHQRCHFVPVLSVPRRDWFCLICQYKAKRIAATKGKGKRGRKSKSPIKLEIEIEEVRDVTKSEHLTVFEIENIYRVDTRSNADTFIGIGGSASAISTMNGNENGNRNSAASPIASASPPPTTKTPPRKDEFAQEDAIIILEQRFEYHSAQLKAELTRKGSQQLVKTIDHNLSSIRLCQNSIRALIETNNRARKALIEKYNKTHQLPQELVQNVMRMARCKLKLREVMHTLQNVIRNKDDRRALSEWFTRAKTEGRFTPAKICQKNPPVPAVISLESTTCTADGECNQNTEIGFDIHVLEGKLFAGDRMRTEPRFDITDYDADADEMSEEEDPTSKIKCSVCFSGEVEEDNDVIMCDGEHCFRAFHMKCCAPHVTQKMLDEDKYGVWFCPYCVCFAKTVHYAQTEYNGYEDDDGASTESWGKAEDVFPEAQAVIKAAEKWKLGKRNDDSDKILAEMLGIEIAKVPGANDAKEGGYNGNDGNDDDDDEDESDFGSDAVSEGSAKSHASDSISSVDWGVKKSELSALSCSESESDSDDDENENEEGSKKGSFVRKSKRLKKCSDNQHETGNGNSAVSGSGQAQPQPPTDIGALDTANIVRGKRSRASVDYNSLNDSMFGKVKRSEIDDEEEYQFVMKRSSGKSDSESDNNDNDDDISSEDEDGSDNSDDNSSKSDSKEDAPDERSIEDADEKTKDDAKSSNRKPWKRAESK